MFYTYTQLTSSQLQIAKQFKENISTTLYFDAYADYLNFHY